LARKLTFDQYWAEKLEYFRSELFRLNRPLAVSIEKAWGKKCHDEDLYVESRLPRGEEQPR
jgi:hypothetical protein